MDELRRDFPGVRIGEITIVEHDAIAAATHDEGIVATTAGERHSPKHVADQDIVVIAANDIVDIAIFSLAPLAARTGFQLHKCVPVPSKFTQGAFMGEEMTIDVIVLEPKGAGPIRNPLVHAIVATHNNVDAPLVQGKIQDVVSIRIAHNLVGPVKVTSRHEPVDCIAADHFTGSIVTDEHIGFSILSGEGLYAAVRRQVGIKNNFRWWSHARAVGWALGIRSATNRMIPPDFRQNFGKDGDRFRIVRGMCRNFPHRQVDLVVGESGTVIGGGDIRSSRATANVRKRSVGGLLVRQ